MFQTTFAVACHMAVPAQLRSRTEERNGARKSDVACAYGCLESLARSFSAKAGAVNAITHRGKIEGRGGPDESPPHGLFLPNIRQSQNEHGRLREDERVSRVV